MEIYLSKYSYNQYNIVIYASSSHVFGLSIIGTHHNNVDKLEKHILRHCPHKNITLKSTTFSDTVYREVVEFLEGNRKDFSVPYILYGTDFQKTIWNSLVKIGYGETITYKALGDLCSTKAYRAVGSAMANNPLPLIVPCHRVLPKSGMVGNYSVGDGTKTKEMLLIIEKVHII